MDAESEATRETTNTKNDTELVRLWLDAIRLADKQEEDWREDAEETIKIYRNEIPKLSRNKDRKFNILHSNVETILPAIYNSTPIPDVRRRFNDEDKTGKAVADMLERAISFAVDAYDFDDIMRASCKDMELCGRGLDRVRYIPYFNKSEESQSEEIQESGQENEDTLAYEEVTCEHVHWKNFRHGPGRNWHEWPWIAFELFLTRDELINLAPDIGGQVNLDSTLADADGDKGDGQNLKELVKRARVWEIWDKETRKVLFIAESYKDKPLVHVDDPLGLSEFFPIPKPLYAIETSDNTVPVIPYEIYRDQADELEHVTGRIDALVGAVRVRGAYDGALAEIEKLSDADDNTLVAIQNVVRYADGNGLEKGIAWWPIEPVIKALVQLVEHRDRVKQAIYEITGISDILRGQTQASETATAQQIKQNWGSLRIQSKQANVARYARDLFRLKAEIIANKFSFQTLSLMTGISFPPMQVKQQAQATAQKAQQMQKPINPDLQKVLDQPAQEEVEQLLRNDSQRSFRVDVESDSTIRADLSRNQQNMAQFLQGTAQFASAMGPIILQPAFQELTPAALEIYSAFARNFKLGKQAEDALDSVADKARKISEQPQQQKPNPQAEVEQARMQADAQKAQLDMQMAQQKHEMEMAKLQAEMAIKREELQLKYAEVQMKADASQAKAALDQQTNQQDAQQAIFQHNLNIAGMEAKHQANMRTMAAKSQQQKQAAND